jgi:hypothetical protein
VKKFKELVEKEFKESRSLFADIESFVLHELETEKKKKELKSITFFELSEFLNFAKQTTITLEELRNRFFLLL